MTCRSLFAVLGLIFLTSATTAEAVTVATYDFTGGSGNAASYDFTSSSIDVTVTGNATSGSTTTAADVTRASGGLGVLGGTTDELGSGPASRRESLFFTFEEAIFFSSIVFTGVSENEQVRFFIDGVFFADFTFTDTNHFTYNFAGTPGGTVLGVETRGENDGYRISGFTVITPVPAALPLMLSGLALLGFLGARRRRIVDLRHAAR